MDISEEMIRHARRPAWTSKFDVRFGGSCADSLAAEFLSHAISVESSYYWRALRRHQRYFSRSQRWRLAWMLITTTETIRIATSGVVSRVHASSFRRRMGQLFRDAGFTNVTHERIIDRSPSSEVYTGRWFRDAAHVRLSRKKEHCSSTERGRKAGYLLNQMAQVYSCPRYHC